MITTNFDNSNEHLYPLRDLEKGRPSAMLRGTQRVYLKQEVDWMKVAVDIEGRMEYLCYDASKVQPGSEFVPVGNPMFHLSEKSGFCNRLFCPPENREMKIQIRDVANGGSADPFVVLEKNYSFTCFCLDRPNFMITLNDNGKKTNMGRIEYPFNCCDYNFNIFDAKGGLKFRVLGDCCQCGVLFPRGCCASCNNADFPVVSASGDEVTMIKRINHDPFKGCLAQTDDYYVDFQPSLDYFDRVLLIGATLMLNLMIYRPSRRDQNKHDNH